MERYLKYLKKKGKRTVLIRHFDPDDWIREHLDFDDKLDLYKKPSEYIYESYSNLDLVLGDRGHTQMIAFACGCKILIPVSHDKLRFFMEDMDLMDYSIEEYDERLSDKLIDRTEKLEKVDWRAIHEDRMRTIAETNKENLRIIHERMKELGSSGSKG
jgi:polysaccharide pyruvyl transferase WcaK-like protein